MKSRNRRDSAEGSSQDVLGPLQDLIRQLRSGARTKQELVDFNEGCNPFQKKAAAKPLSQTEQIRQLQMEHLRAKGYALDEKDVPLPDEAKLKLGLALLVDYWTPIDQQCSLLGIKNYLDLSYHEDLHPKPQGRWGWIYEVENGKKMLGRSPNSAIEEFGRNNRRGLMTVEGLALYRENPDLLKDHYVDLSGSRCLAESAPNLYLNGFNGRQPKLFYSWSGNRGPGWGSASCGSR